MRPIDADKLKERLMAKVSGFTYKTIHIDDVVAYIDGSPTAEDESVVRCKECKYWTNGDDTYGICYRCSNTRQMRYDDWCSRADRKE